VGDPVTLFQHFQEVGNYLTCKSMDNRVSIYTLIELVKRVKSRKISLYAVATVQEERIGKLIPVSAPPRRNSHASNPSSIALLDNQRL
jgi:hypothetical protein